MDDDINVLYDLENNTDESDDSYSHSENNIMMMRRKL